MNKHCGRWVFSKVRGCLMVVAEAAKGQGKGGGARGERNRTPVGGASGTVRLVNTLALSAMLTQSLLQPLQAVAQIRADNTAPGAQRPTVLSTGSGLPQVNITTPSAAGIVQPKGPAWPQLIHWRGPNTLRNCAPAICDRPMVLTYTASRPKALFISSYTRIGLIGISV